MTDVGIWTDCSAELPLGNFLSMFLERWQPQQQQRLVCIQIYSREIISLIPLFKNMLLIEEERSQF